MTSLLGTGKSLTFFAVYDFLVNIVTQEFQAETMIWEGVEQMLKICCTVTPLVSVLYSSFSYEQFLSTRCFANRVDAKASVFRAEALVASFSVGNFSVEQ